MGGVTDNFLELRARVISCFIQSYSKKIVQGISLHLKKEKRASKHIETDIDNLPKEKRIKIVFTIAYVLLFNAQRFFGENIIQDEESGVKFESILYDEFKKIAHLDPRPYIGDYLTYVERILSGINKNLGFA